MVLKALTFNIFYFGRVSWSSKKGFFTVDTVGRCGSPERTESTDLILPQ